MSWKQTALLISNRDIVISPLLHHYYLRFRFNASTSHTTGRKGLVTHLGCPQTDLLIASVVMEMVSPGLKHNTEEALLVTSHPPATIPNQSSCNCIPCSQSTESHGKVAQILLWIVNIHLGTNFHCLHLFINLTCPVRVTLLARRKLAVHRTCTRDLHSMLGYVKQNLL